MLTAELISSLPLDRFRAPALHLSKEEAAMKSLFAICFCILLLTFLAGTSLAQTNPVPVVDQPLIPASVQPGSKGFKLTVNGSGFASGAVVNWNGSPRLTLVTSSHQVQANIKASDVAKSGTATVTVVNPNPGGGTSNVLYLPIHNPTKSVAFGRDAKVTPQGGVTTTGDFNGDGIVDFAVAGSGTLFVYLGKGDGTFGPPIRSSLDTIGADSVLAADFNNDGKLDLLVVGGVGGGNSEVDILLGDGTGRFNLSDAIPFGNADFPQATAAGDLNGDGKLDFVLSDFGETGNGVIIVYLGNGNGTFRQGSTLVDLGAGNFPVLADFNRDGNLDVAMAIGNAVAIYLGKGDGTFVDGGVYSTNNFASSVATADINGDGKLDLITDGVDVLLGNGDGTFSQGASVPVASRGTVPSCWATSIVTASWTSGWFLLFVAKLARQLKSLCCSAMEKAVSRVRFNLQFQRAASTQASVLPISMAMEGLTLWSGAKHRAPKCCCEGRPSSIPRTSILGRSKWVPTASHKPPSSPTLGVRRLRLTPSALGEIPTISLRQTTAARAFRRMEVATSR